MTAAGCALSLAGAADAAAWTNTYCGVLINSGSWCGDGSDHTYDSNKAYYTGTGSVWVCERLINASTRSVRGTPKCEWNSIYHYYGATGSTFFEADVKHESGSARHTIWGEAIA